MDKIKQLHNLTQESKALDAKIKALKAELVSEYGQGKHECNSLVLSIANVAESDTPDYKTLCEKLKPSAYMLNKYRKIRKGYKTVKVGVI